MTKTLSDALVSKLEKSPAIVKLLSRLSELEKNQSLTLESIKNTLEGVGSSYTEQRELLEQLLSTDILSSDPTSFQSLKERLEVWLSKHEELEEDYILRKGKDWYGNPVTKEEFDEWKSKSSSQTTDISDKLSTLQESVDKVEEAVTDTSDKVDGVGEHLDEKDEELSEEWDAIYQGMPQGSAESSTLSYEESTQEGELQGSAEESTQEGAPDSTKSFRDKVSDFFTSVKGGFHSLTAKVKDIGGYVFRNYKQVLDIATLVFLLGAFLTKLAMDFSQPILDYLSGLYDEWFGPDTFLGKLFRDMGRGITWILKKLGLYHDAIPLATAQALGLQEGTDYNIKDDEAVLTTEGQKTYDNVQRLEQEKKEHAKAQVRGTEQLLDPSKKPNALQKAWDNVTGFFTGRYDYRDEESTAKDVRDTNVLLPENVEKNVRKLHNQGSHIDSDGNVTTSSPSSPTGPSYNGWSPQGKDPFQSMPTHNFNSNSSPNIKVNNTNTNHVVNVIVNDKTNPDIL